MPSCTDVLKNYDPNNEYSDSVEGHLTIADLNYYIKEIAIRKQKGEEK